MKLLTLISMLLVACGGPECDMCPQYDWGFRYSINTYISTGEGIKVDSTGQTIDTELVDSMTNEVIECLNEKFPDGKMSKDIMEKAHCVSGPEIKSIDKSCIIVKIPDDWIWSCDGTMQLLKDLAPQKGCTSKGIEPYPGCPCRWRAGVQGNNSIIVTPNLYLYKDPLVKIFTGCWNPWGSAELSRCMLE